MTEEQSDREFLLAICHELLRSLERFLVTRQLGTQRLRFTFFHLRAPATQVFLGGAEFERRAEHWLDLLRIRFERVVLPEPVIAVRLQGGRHQAMRYRGSVAFPDEIIQWHSWPNDWQRVSVISLCTA